MEVTAHAPRRSALRSALAELPGDLRWLVTLAAATARATIDAARVHDDWLEWLDDAEDGMFGAEPPLVETTIELRRRLRHWQTAPGRTLNEIREHALNWFPFIGADGVLFHCSEAIFATWTLARRVHDHVFPNTPEGTDVDSREEVAALDAAAGTVATVRHSMRVTSGCWTAFPNCV